MLAVGLGEGSVVGSEAGLALVVVGTTVGLVGSALVAGSVGAGWVGFDTVADSVVVGLVGLACLV